MKDYMSKSILQARIKRGVKVFPGLINRITRYGVFSYDLMPSYWKRAKYVYSDGDYVRNSTLELLSREIYEKKVEGAVAELGVFRGDFSKLINQAFPNRKLYLYDTFSGFATSDMKMEGAEKKDDFSGTSVKYVLSKMKHRKNCVVRKGYFPDTFVDEKEMFAFVSIDCDLYKPIYDGLCIFWEHISPGGYIMVHDYQNSFYPNAKKAIDRFCKEKHIVGVPISDVNGSMVLAKQRS